MIGFPRRPGESRDPGRGTFRAVAAKVRDPDAWVLALAGTVCLAFGTLTLIDAPIPELAVQPALAVSLCIAFGAITFLLLRLALAARRNKALIGPAALVGSLGVAMEPIWTKDTLPVGRILVQGEIWQATAVAPVPEQDSVRVVGFHGDVLEVAPDVASQPR